MSSQFNAAMLIVARQSRGFSQTALAKASNVSQSKVSKIENGVLVPAPDLVEQLADVLRFKPSFFYRDSALRPAPQSYHRKRQKLAAGDWEAIIARAEIYRLAIERMLLSVELESSLPLPPAIDPDQFDGRIEEIAKAIRQLWMLPRGPIADVAKTLEDAGIVIVPFDFGTDLIDGFCQHASDGLPPLIFLNTRFKNKDRVRFSLAHELAHLVMHRMPHPAMEDEANQFAAAFLMPFEDISASFFGMSVDKLMMLKMHWKTSMQAIARRARDLGMLSERSYKYYQIEMSRRGWRSAEPVPISGNIEIPATLKQLAQAHSSDLGYSADDMAEMIGLYPEEIEQMFPPDRPRLRLVV